MTLFAALALLVVAVLVAPVVLTVGSGAPRCQPSLRFAGRVYHRVPAPAGAPLQRIAIGLGVLSGCGQAPTNANVRSLSGVQRTRAVGLEGDQALFVRAGVCASVATGALARCLSRP